jgi:hypothetical protein
VSTLDEEDTAAASRTLSLDKHVDAMILDSYLLDFIAYYGLLYNLKRSVRRESVRRHRSVSSKLAVETSENRAKQAIC